MILYKINSLFSFRHGKMYRYSSSTYDITALTTFAIDGFVKARSEPITPPKAPLFVFYYHFISSSITLYNNFFFFSGKICFSAF